jgi:hypothetical protein
MAAPTLSSDPTIDWWISRRQVVENSPQNQLTLFVDGKSFENLQQLFLQTRANYVM